MTTAAACPTAVLAAARGGRGPRRRPARAAPLLCRAAGDSRGDGPAPSETEQLGRRVFGAAWPLGLLWLLTRQAPVDAGAVAVARSDAEWRAQLSPEAYHVLVERGTERSFTSPLNGEQRRGTFRCAGCSSPLFSTEDKFDSGTGWPSFAAALPGQTGLTVQPLYLLGDASCREVRCATCGGHLGHVFGDGPPPTRRRYCINGVALDFQPGP